MDSAVAARGWLILTRDRHIREHRLEIDAVRAHRAKMIALTGGEAGNTFAQLEVVMCQWRAIEGCWNEPAPFIYAATRSRLKKIDLD
jgi:PIN like domain